MVRWSNLWGEKKDRHGSKVWGEYEMYHFFSYLGLSVFSIGSRNFCLIWLLVKPTLIKISLFCDFCTSESGVFFEFCERVDRRYDFLSPHCAVVLAVNENGKF